MWGFKSTSFMFNMNEHMGFANQMLYLWVWRICSFIYVHKKTANAKTCQNARFTSIWSRKQEFIFFKSLQWWVTTYTLCPMLKHAPFEVPVNLVMVSFRTFEWPLNSSLRWKEMYLFQVKRKLVDKTNFHTM